MSKFVDIKGQRFGRLTVLARAPSRSRKTQWLCLCDCGRETTPAGEDIRRGQTRSCGCLITDTNAVTKHKHGYSHTRIYKIWRDMRQRCTNPNRRNYKWYGAKGVNVCDRWMNSFKAFLEDMGEPERGMSLDRIDPFGNYEPGNCRWADTITQANNRREGQKAA